MACASRNDGKKIQGDRWQMKVSDEPISRRRSWSGNPPAAAPPIEWKFYAGVVSARKLAASLWQLAATTNSSGDVRWQRLGLELCSAPSISRSSKEGATKWDNVTSKSSPDLNHTNSHARLVEHQERETISLDITQARPLKEQKCISDNRGSPANELIQIRATVRELKDDVRRARKTCKKMKVLCSKFIHDYDKEKKARQLLEDLCIEQAKEVKACKAEIKELRNQCLELQQEMAEDWRMLQIAEAWREERTQMKLLDAKLMLEDKYSQMSNIIAYLKTLCTSSNFTIDVNDFDPRVIQADSCEVSFVSSKQSK